MGRLAVGCTWMILANSRFLGLSLFRWAIKSPSRQEEAMKSMNPASTVGVCLAIVLFMTGCGDGESIADNATSMDGLADVDDVTEVDGMALIPAGSFWMGCNEAVDWRCATWLDPYHEVYLDGFYMDETEVTMKAFQDCVTAGVCSHHLKDGACYYMIFETLELAQGRIWPAYQGDNQPMVCVDWTQAKQYCEWVGKRLPTEAEWEKAARGTDGRVYPWGNDDPDCAHAVMTVGDGSECAPEVTADICSKSPVGDSIYGLCDMAGNVTEWVADWYSRDYYNVGPTENPTGPDTGERKITRGGGIGFSGNVRSSARKSEDPSKAFVYGGFRCARDL
ncbi:MAG TPA: SUMF1/EgtB/PvdO family nonheme iron enzyme [Myxococcota bacterium]|nr:SUMF1/EgtB/PvdO family nonheme iron enzyme [Myxococcota bacterium]